MPFDSIKNFIDHEGIITDIDNQNHIIKVRIDNLNECGDCPAIETCENNGSPSNEISIYTQESFKYKVNDIITVRGTEKMHRKAIIIAMFIPFLVFVAVIVGVYLLTQSQLASSLSGIGTIILFFIFLWLGKNKISKEFTFTIIGEIQREGNEN